MQLTAGLLTYNDGKYAGRCLETLVAQTGLGTLNRDWRIVVLDNASRTRGRSPRACRPASPVGRDPERLCPRPQHPPTTRLPLDSARGKQAAALVEGSTERKYLSELERRFPNVQFVFEQENHGFAKGHNIIMRRFPADFHAVLNNDILFRPDFLALLVNALEEQPSAGSATGKLLHWDFGGHPGKTNIIDSCGIGVTFARAFLDIGQGETDRGQYDAPAERFGGSGAATVYRRTALEETLENGAFFDERMFMYKEDVDLAYRLFEAGHPCLYVPAAVAWHARTTFKPRHARSVQERIRSAAHESLILRKHKRQWSFGARCCTMLRQWCKWLYLLICEPAVFTGARRLLRKISA